jgi:hypothetical protein
LTLRRQKLTGEWSPADACCERLTRAGWSAGDALVQTPEGPAWIVTGTNRGKAIHAAGRTQAEAWMRACEQAEAAGMLKVPG